MGCHGQGRPCRDLRMSGEWLIVHTLSKVHLGQALVLLISLGMTPVELPNHRILAYLYV